jgi:hydrogenase maturation factor
MLEGLLARYTGAGDRVLIGPRVGEDATVISFGDTCLVAKTDPITFATDEIGHYAIHVNANDIATMGAVPRWFLATLLLPQGRTDAALVEDVLASIHRAAESIGVAFCGGHTEITVGLDRPIVVGQMLGEVAPDAIVRSSGLGVGDVVLLTKGLGIEATSLIAREKRAELLALGRAAGSLDAAANYLHDPGISVLREARIACECARVHAMHDPTEGGVATALRELARAAGTGLVADGDALYMSNLTRDLCEAFNLDPLGVISSGALLIGLAEPDAACVCDAIQAQGIDCEAVARVVPKERGLKMQRRGKTVDLPMFDRDEIGKIYN